MAGTIGVRPRHRVYAAMTHLKLSTGFPSAGRADWLELVQRVVDGPVDAALSFATRDGFRVEALSGQHHAAARFPHPGRRWRVMQRVDHPDPSAANAFAHADLDGGADGLEVILPGSCAANGYGVGIETVDDLDRLFADIDLERVPIRMDGGYEIRQALSLVVALIERRGCDPAKVEIVGQSDPPNGMFADGRLTAPYDLIGEWAADIVHALVARGLGVTLLSADGRSVHAGGGSNVEELAYVVADGVGHMRMLERSGVRLEDAARQLSFVLAADTDLFATISKFRAFRVLWARVTEACGLPSEPARLTGETSWRMMARRDPWVNILRVAMGVSGAGLGGADSVVALPFTAARGLPDAFARRLARNTQLVLLEEAGLADVADPAAGAGHVEEITQNLAEGAWELFRDIERQGGLATSLRNGDFQARVLRTAQKRRSDVATRRDPLVGVSEYAWLDELPVRTIDTEPFELRGSGTPLDLPPPGRGERFEGLVNSARDGASLADMLASLRTEWERTERVPKWRLAEPFERLRDAADRHLDENGRRPMVFIAHLGAPAAHAARASWITGAFAAGGIEAVAGEGGEDAAVIAAEFSRSGCRIACICGKDDDYPRLAALSAGSLKAIGADGVYLAGRPGDGEAELRRAGIDGFLYEGCDILAVLEDAQRRLAVGEAATAAAGDDA